MLRALRTDHGVSLNALRQAIDYAKKTLYNDRLLLSSELRADARRLLLERYSELIDLSASGQIAVRRFFDEHLKRVEWEEREFPVRLYPLTSGNGPAAQRLVSIDAAVTFGRLVLVHRGISTRAIVERIDAGETVAEVAGLRPHATGNRGGSALRAGGLSPVFFADRGLGKRFPEILAAAGPAMNHDTPTSFIAG